ncbi:hypothetical protein L4C34_15050 [Vibrio profundum]
MWILGLLPFFANLIEQIPTPVLGGATLVMFGSVVATGIRIITQKPLGQRAMLIVALLFSVGLGIEAVPEILRQLPDSIQHI